MDKKKVSILIAQYNAEKWIGATVESALKQTYENIEIIIVDDGSTDNSLEIAESYGAEKITVYSQENKGACAARNKALELASGDYINYLDADDLIAPDKIELQMQLIDEFGDDVIVSGSWAAFLDSPADSQPKESALDKDYNEPIDWLIDSWNGKGMAIPAVWLTPAVLIRKAGAWNERLKINQDGEFFTRVLLKAKAIKYCKGAKTYYRRANPNSISTGVVREADSLLLSYQLSREHVLNKRDDVSTRKALAHNFQRAVYLCYKTAPDVVRLAQDEVKSLNVKAIPIYGGGAFIFLSRITSFSFAMKCRSLLT